MEVILTEFGQVSEPEKISTILAEDYTVYEVFRVVQGMPLFLEDHFDRLLRSMELNRMVSPLSFVAFRGKVTGLIRASKKSEGNIRFVILPADKGPTWYFAFIPAVYPDVKDLSTGVDTELFEAERENPKAKVLQKNVRFAANQLIEEHHIYEVLLVDHEGFITEGSRSNVFFVKGDVFYTAPAEKVLVGITRIKVFDCLKELGYQIVEESIHKSALNSFDAVFLTGTSPKVLPVRSIGALSYRTESRFVRLLMKKYDEVIAEYIDQEKNKRQL